MQKLSCVVPAYNEEESIPHLWSALKPILSRYPDWELLVVSDGSTDNTIGEVQKIAATESRVRLIDLRRNQGKSAALMAGFRAVTGDRVVTLDADLQDDPQEIPPLLAILDEQNMDMVGGWKRDRHDPWVKKLSSKVFNGVANRIMQAHFHDLNCGLKAYRREVVDTLDLYGDLYRFIPILALANGWRVTEKPVVHHARAYGVSKYGLRLNGLFDLISLLMIAKYRWKPLHFFGRWGLSFLLIGIAMLVFLTVEHFIGKEIGDRPLLLFGALFVLAGMQLLFTGLLADLILLGHDRKKR